MPPGVVSGFPNMTPIFSRTWFVNMQSVPDCAIAAVSFLFCIWALITALCGRAVAGWASMTCIICFVSGVQLICLGIIAEYIGKIYMETKQRPRYIISERTWEKED